MGGGGYKDPSVLHELYVGDELTYEQIAERFGVSSSTIGNWINRHGIERDQTDKYPWRDAQKLRRKYWRDEMSIGEIAEGWGTYRDIIHRWLVRHDIERRPGPDAHYPWQSKEVLRELYAEQELSQSEIAAKFDTQQTTISKWIRRFGIETPVWYEAGKQARRVERAFFFTDQSGYEISGTRVGETAKNIQIHRLVAVANEGIEAVRDKVVHHKNGIPWDNRPGNLVLMDGSEHKRLHAENRPRDGRKFW